MIDKQVVDVPEVLELILGSSNIANKESHLICNASMFQNFLSDTCELFINLDCVYFGVSRRIRSPSQSRVSAIPSKLDEDFWVDGL